MKQIQLNILRFLYAEDVRYILGLFIIWHIVLFLVGYFGVGRFPLQINFYGNGSEVNFFKSWANWDGGHYIGIAENGYAHLFQRAFFPLYPLLIKGMSFITGENFFTAAFIVSRFATLGLLYVLYFLVRDLFDRNTAKRAVLYLLLFPSSLYLMAAYTESVFLLCVVLAFYLSFRRYWLLAALFAAVATSTRPVGVFVCIGLFVEYLAQREFSVLAIKKDILWLVLSPLGLFAYMFYLFSEVGDPFYFIEAQSHWNRNTTALNPVTVLYEQWQRLISIFAYDTPGFVSGATDFIFTIFFIIGSLLVIKKIKLSLGLYSLGVVLLPVTTGILSSMPRLGFVAFPLIILLAIWGKNELVDKLIIILFTAFLGLFTVLFINGAWLA